MIVYKYPFEAQGFWTQKLPVGARIIHVGLDPQGRKCFWAEVDPRNAMVPRWMGVVGTGDPTPPAAKHVGTLMEGHFVWHLYAGPERVPAHLR